MNQARREPAAGDAADVGDQVDDGDGGADFCEYETMLALEEIGNPEEVEPPDGIGEKFADDEGVGLTVREKRGPFDFADGFGRIGADVAELGWGYARMFVRFAVE